MKTTGTPWPNILADLEAKRGAIDTLIGLVREHFVGDDPTAMPESPAPSNGKATRAKNGRDGTGRDGSKARASATRSLPDGAVSEVGQKILALLKKGPMATSAMAKALGLNSGTAVLYHVNKLLKAQLVEGSGRSSARVIHLPGHGPARRDL
jgi:hypothetical protein